MQHGCQPTPKKRVQLKTNNLHTLTEVTKFPQPADSTRRTGAEHRDLDGKVLDDPRPNALYGVHDEL